MLRIHSHRGATYMLLLHICGSTVLVFCGKLAFFAYFCNVFANFVAIKKPFSRNLNLSAPQWGTMRSSHHFFCAYMMIRHSLHNGNSSYGTERTLWGLTLMSSKGASNRFSWPRCYCKSTPCQPDAASTMDSFRVKAQWPSWHIIGHFRYDSTGRGPNLQNFLRS